MSYVLRKNGQVVLSTLGWSPSSFSSILGTSFPSDVDQTYTWTDSDHVLAWENDPPVIVNPNESVLAQIASIEANFTDTLKMRAIIGDATALSTVTNMLQQIDALKAQLV